MRFCLSLVYLAVTFAPLCRTKQNTGTPATGTQQQTDPNSAVVPSVPIPPVQTTVTVNGTIESATPASISVLTNEQLQTIPGNNLDDRLRQIPGFSLFRRSSSLVANPTTQGVSLRATGSSGASRTLVLLDSIPINDPFGGWVYWTRVDPGFIDRVEVNRGGTTAVFGDRAFGGSISLFSPQPQKDHLYAEVTAGNEGTVDTAAAYSNVWGRWALTAHSRALTTDGYYIVPANLRGRVDDKANVRFATGDLHLDYLGVSDRLSIHFDLLAEERANGTTLTHNSTGLGTLAANYNHSWSNDQVSFLVFHTREQFHSTFSSVALNRNRETLTSRQTVPAEDIGGAGYWQHHGRFPKGTWNTVVGADVDDTHGTSFDYSYTTRVLAKSGGTLLEHGLFGQGDVSLGPVQFFGGIRHQFTGQHGETFVSPNGGIAYGLRQFRFRASGYRTFRAPTLNELYRALRVGNALTLANAGLLPEGLVGVEVGGDWVGEKDRVSFSLFRNDLSNLIGNATLSSSPTLILRQRANFPSALSRGVEANVLHRWHYWTGELGYLFADSRYSNGARLAQVPKQQGTAALTFAAKGTSITGGLRSYGLQFDDDQNQFKLPGFTALQLAATQHIVSNLSAIAQVDNLLDRSYLVALTPTPNTGSPRLWRLGLRWSGPVH